MKGQEMRLRNSFVDERSGTGSFCMPLNDGGVRDFVGSDLWKKSIYNPAPNVPLLLSRHLHQHPRTPVIEARSHEWCNLTF